MIEKKKHNFSGRPKGGRQSLGGTYNLKIADQFRPAPKPVFESEPVKIGPGPIPRNNRNAGLFSRVLRSDDVDYARARQRKAIGRAIRGSQ